MRAKDMYVQPGNLLRRMHQIATATFSAVNSDCDITAVQFASLLAIRDKPGIDATRLAEAIRFDRTTIGHVIGRLEQKGLIVRTEGSLDKRTKELQITVKGSELLEEIGPRVQQVSDTVLAPLSEPEKSEFLRILRVLDNHASKVARSADTMDDG